MKRWAVLLPFALAACPSDGDKNPAVLWLAPKDGEVDVQLSGTKPPDF